MATRCDEGGQHDFRAASATSGVCDWVTCCFCWPCLVCMSCMCSHGAVQSNPVFESCVRRNGGSHARRACGGSTRRSKEPICEKCGLSEQEATDLAMARDAERAGNGTGHFNAHPELQHPGEAYHDPRLTTRIHGQPGHSPMTGYETQQVQQPQQPGHASQQPSYAPRMSYEPQPASPVDYAQHSPRMSYAPR